MSNNPLIVVITGSNRGIGHATTQTLSSQQGPSPLIIYATSRSGSSDLNLTPRPPNEIRCAKLGISSRASVTSFLDDLKEKGEEVDVLVNNAGVNLDEEYNYENARKTFEVNYWGTRGVCELFLSEGGMSSSSSSLSQGEKRIVNVSSSASQLTNYSDSIVSRFRTITSFSQLDEIVDEYLSSVREGTERENGWNHINASYSVSKACLNAATFLLARENRGGAGGEGGGKVLINCCCPGWVNTDMGSQVGDGGKDPLDGARIPVRLAVGDIGDVTGAYWANGSVKDTGEGRVREW